MPNAAVTTLLDRLPDAKPARVGWKARCPAHEDHTPSLSISEGEKGGAVVKCFAGCTEEAIVCALGLARTDLFPPRTTDTRRHIVAEYPYHDEQGTLLYTVVRFEPKDFRQRLANGDWKLGDVRRVVYRLPQLAGHEAIFKVEGEKDADALTKLGVPATCNPGGAGKWRDDYARQLVLMGVKRVYILPDNDDPGRAHAHDVARSCTAAGIAARIVTLPNLPQKGDVSDYLAAGGTKSDLLTLATAAALWTPAASTDRLTSPAGLDLVELGALLAEPDEAAEWLVADRLAFGSVNLLAGRPKAGKSTLARALALAVARGESWLGGHCHLGRVVYVALEDKRSEVRRHLRNMGATGDESIRLLIGRAPRLLLENLAALIAGGDTIDLLIIDTAQRLLALKDANDYSQVTAAFEPVLALARRHGTCIVLLHHAGKADRAGIEQILGSTAWAGSVDNVLLLNRTDRYRVLSSVQRIGPDLDETVVQMDEATGEVRLAGSRYLVDRQVIAAAMFDAVAGAGPQGITRPDLLAAIEARRELKLKALALLASDPRVEHNDTGTGRNHIHIYRLVSPEPVSDSVTTQLNGFPGSLIEREPVSLSTDSPMPTEVQRGSQECAGSHGSEDATKEGSKNEFF